MRARRFDRWLFARNARVCITPERRGNLFRVTAMYWSDEWPTGSERFFKKSHWVKFEYVNIGPVHINNALNQAWTWLHEAYEASYA
jgi:hypothetical protein